MWFVQSTCPLIPACPTAFDYRCADMTCQQNCTNIPALNTIFAEYVDI